MWYMLVQDLYLCFLDCHGKRTCAALLMSGCSLLLLSFCSDMARLSASLPGESTLLSLKLALHQGLDSSKSLEFPVHSFKGFFETLHQTLPVVLHVPSFTEVTAKAHVAFKGNNSIQTAFPMSVLCLRRQFMQSRSPRYSCIHFHCLRIWLFLNVLENPSKCRLLCYKFIIQFGLNDGLTGASDEDGKYKDPLADVWPWSQSSPRNASIALMAPK